MSRPRPLEGLQTPASHAQRGARVPADRVAWGFSEGSRALFGRCSAARGRRSPLGVRPEPASCPHSVPGWVGEALQRERPLQRRRQQAGGRVLPVPCGLPGAAVHRLRGRLLQLAEECDTQRLLRFGAACVDGSRAPVTSHPDFWELRGRRGPSTRRGGW